MARKFLPTLGRAGLSGAAQRAAQSARYFPLPGMPYDVNWSVDRAVTEGMERNTWVYKPVDAIASRASSLRIGVRLGDAEDGEWQDPMDRFVNKVLNKRANPSENARALRYRASAQVLLSKRGTFVEVVLNRAGRVAELHMLPVDRTRPVPADTEERMINGWAQLPAFAQDVQTANTLIASFEVRYQDGRVAYLPPFDAENPQTNSVLWLRKPHPIDPFIAMTPFEAAGLAIDTSFYAKLFNRNFMANDGRPGGILAIKGETDPEDAAELKSRFGGGVERAGRITVMEADAVNFVDTATTPRDAQYVESQGMTKEEILIAFGTPESVLGNAAGRTFDNADAEEEIFWRHTMKDHLAIMEDGWDQLLEVGVMDDDYVRHNLDGIGVLQREKRTEYDRLAMDYDRGAISLDEYLEGTGRKALGVPASRVVWIAPGKFPIGDDLDVSQALAASKQTVGEPQPADPAAEARTGAQQGVAIANERADRARENRQAAAELAAPVIKSADEIASARSLLEQWADAEDDETPLGVKVRALPAPRRELSQQVKDALSNTTGIMVCLKPEGATLDALDQVADTPRDEIHLTLGYLGQIGEHDDVTPEALFEMVEQSVRMSAAELAPLSGEISGWTRFKAGDEGRPTVALADMPGLNGWRESLVREINRMTGSATVYENHGYTPHITLGYDLDGEGHDNLDSLEGLALEFSDVYLVWGEDWHRYPLEGDFDGSLVQQVAAVEGSEWAADD